MKKIAALLASAFVLGTAGIASADPIGTPIGNAYVNEGGYVIFADGAEGNPDPVDGYASLSSGGQGCADDNGGWGTAGTSPTCTP